MIKKHTRLLICMSAALILPFVSYGNYAVNAEEDNPVTAVSNTEDLTESQYYFEEEAGLVFPGWNTYSEETADPIPNVSGEPVVAVVDGGVDYTHPDLKNVMWTDPEKKYGGGVYGYNAINAGAEPMDETGHGTHIAGIIAAEWNKQGISGALSGAKIMAVKATSNGMTGDVVNGLSYVLNAKRNGVNVAAVNLSWNGGTAYSFPETMNKVINDLGKAGVITVIAAGNASLDLDETVQLSNYFRANPYVIVVSASDQEKELYEESNYGLRYSDLIAPGELILSTDTTYEAPAESTSAVQKTAENTEVDQETEQVPEAPEGYRYLSGTSMAAPIVTALAAYTYAQFPNLTAAQRAARILENAASFEASPNAVSAGFAQIVDEEKTKPLPAGGEIKDGSVTISGYDFGTSTGTVTIDSKEYLATAWTDTKITLKCDSLTLGEHQVTVTRKDKEKLTRWISVDGSTDDAEMVSVKELDSMYAYGIDTAGDTMYLSGIPSSNDRVPSVYSYADETWIRLTYTAPEESFIPLDSCGADGKLYCISSTKLMIVDPEYLQETKLVSLNVPDIIAVRIQNLNGNIYVSYTVDPNEAEDVTVIAQYEPDNTNAPLTKLYEIKQDDLYAAGIAKVDGKLVAACVNTAGADYKLDVYELPEEETDPVLLFETTVTGTPKQIHVCGYEKTLGIYGITKTDTNGSVHNVVKEYNLSGEVCRTVTYTGGHLNSIAGELTGNMVYIAGTTDALCNNLFLYKIGLKGSAEPEPSVTPEPSPSTEPSASPSASSAPSVTATPGTTVVTCQDAGFPAGWYWNESKKACVAPMNNSGGNGGTTNGTTNNNAGNYTAPAGTPAANNTSAAPESNAEAEKSSTPETESSASPSASAETTPEPKESGLPIEVVNTKGTLWFLGIPVLMILSGILIYMLKNGALIPWIIGIDAIAGVALAILDHSIVAWILLVLNLAAIGLLALYRSGKPYIDE